MPLDTSDDVHFWPVTETRRRGEVQVEDDSAGGRGAPQPPGHPHPHALWPLRAPLQESNQNSLLQRTVLLGLWHKVKTKITNSPRIKTIVDYQVCDEIPEVLGLPKYRCNHEGVATGNTVTTQ